MRRIRSKFQPARLSLFVVGALLVLLFVAPGVEPTSAQGVGVCMEDVVEQLDGVNAVPPVNAGRGWRTHSYSAYFNVLDSVTNFVKVSGIISWFQLAPFCQHWNTTGGIR